MRTKLLTDRSAVVHVLDTVEDGLGRALSSSHLSKQVAYRQLGVVADVGHVCQSRFEGVLLDHSVDELNAFGVGGDLSLEVGVDVAEAASARGSFVGSCRQEKINKSN